MKTFRLNERTLVDVLRAAGLNGNDVYIYTNGAIYFYDKDEEYEPENTIYSYDVTLFADVLRGISLYESLTDDRKPCVKVEQKHEEKRRIECFTFDEVVEAVKELFKLPSKAAA